MDYLWTFEIDRPALVHIAFDSRGSMPEKRKQEPKDWFTKGFSDTGEVLFLDAPHPQTEYWIYESNEPYPRGKVTLFGIEPSELGNQTLWLIFVGEGELAVTSSKKLATRWGAIKSLK